MAREYDVIIVGAGMVGALTAVLTAQKGLTVALIDKHSGRYPLSTPPAYDARVSAISALSQQLLEQAGAWQRIAQERLAPYQRMAVWDGLGDGYVDFDSRYQQPPYLGQLVENAVLCDALMKSVHDTRGIDLYFDDSVQAQRQVERGVEIDLSSDRQLLGAVLIAADGANSKLRHDNGFDTVEWDYGHHAIVTTVEIDRSHQDTAWQAFGEEGILAFLPLPSVDGRHFVSIVWSVAPSDAEQLVALEEAAFCRRLTYAMNGAFEALSLTVPRQAIPLRQRHAKQYVQEGIALIGDAAHTIHPLAGQGANLGFADVSALVPILVKAHQRGEALGDLKTLRRYQRARMLDNIAMSASMEAFKRTFSTQQPAIVQLRNIGLKLCHQSSMIKRQLVAHAAGLR
ncbi:UbiH/UbiF/VisC/COQ6 family ubiquinone biosynthesis hydroxylase [Marinomonas ostreistagni]|uniref:UbiH/UbiF/VisC/COQ6 family ubiquinone biosynthesis hydroxylase n=1 Tax=Marinomonas ostreistagni TaxID=359209 RepID=UPI00195210D4|nr:UbiH/UbiF/VisC/COQ6 family ubiquinone biosynthesis hydroxylase [Marinomonas ostreistagni]MBM6552136.1 UbiH/UbiF/VisC/COQ6 family ubiquinone biosynthesis hydroxylase [Marinomonas ostreistagni]